MADHVFLLSRDLEFADGLTSRLTSAGIDHDDIEIHLRVAELSRQMAATPFSTVFVDFREPFQVPELGRFFEELREGRLGSVDLVSVSQGSLPLEFAAAAELYSVKSLRVPFAEGECDRVAQYVASGGRVNGHRRLPQCRTLAAEGYSITSGETEMCGMLDLLERVAPRDVTLLLVGETGTGKTTLAQIIHSLSPRRDEPFHNVACGALPPDLIESDLFGHARGAFTGAERDKIGRFEAARRGTLLLDEIDVLGPKEQVKLLRVIETGQFEPVGTTRTRESQARLIVASNVDLESCVESQQFRSDLYYRLNVLQFRLPPLRDRLIDIAPMAVSFIQECCQQHNIRIQRVGRDFLDVLKRYPWPGNIRELKNQVQRAVLFNEDGTLTADDLPETLLQSARNGSPPAEENGRHLTLAERVAHSERQILEEELQIHNQCRTTTAKSLGISRVGLYKKMKKHGMM
jgi:DNA-binding NtrC family response regulator